MTRDARIIAAMTDEELLAKRDELNNWIETLGANKVVAGWLTQVNAEIANRHLTD
jgi:hypothetical protein